MKKVLIVSGHSNIQHDSVMNSLILKQVKQALPQVEIDLLCELYPDFKIDVAAEQAKVLEADIIVFQFPLYWFAKPSILQRWEEEVFLHGFSHGSNGDKLKGKKLIVSFTVGAPGEVYSREGGLGYTLEDLLLPVSRSTAGFVGMTLEPFIYTTGVSYALRSDEAQAKQLEEKALLHAQRLVEAIEKA